MMKFYVINKRISIFIIFLFLVCLTQFVHGSGKHLTKSSRNGTTSKAYERLFDGILAKPPSKNRRQLDDDNRTLLRTILNASGVLGLGFLWIKEITAAIDSPILAPFLMPPLFAVSILVLFFPQIGRFIETLLFG